LQANFPEGRVGKRRPRLAFGTVSVPYGDVG
jgi:hypothetical protein